MKNIPIPIIDSQLTLEAIIASKRIHQAVLVAMKPDLLMQYKNYENNTNRLERVKAFSSFSQNCIEAIQHCYSVGTKPLESLKTAIFNSLGDVGMSYCPYCLISEP